MKLLTNNPAKVSEVFSRGFEVEKVPLAITPTKYNARYFDTKRKKFKHTFGEKDSYHYFGITYSDYDADINGVLAFLRNARKHPLLKFHFGLNVNQAILNDENAVEELNNSFSQIAAEPTCIPVVHYSARGSTDPMADIREIRVKFPRLTHIQVNDDESGRYVQLLTQVGKSFTFIASLSDDNFSVIDDLAFRELVLNTSSFILLDNSKGKGKKESYEVYKDKIGKCLNYGLNNLALAGGFSAESLDVYFQLKNFFKIDFSIDAESRLQTDGKLDAQKAIAYLEELLKS